MDRLSLVVLIYAIAVSVLIALSAPGLGLAALMAPCVLFWQGRVSAGDLRARYFWMTRAVKQAVEPVVDAEPVKPVIPAPAGDDLRPMVEALRDGDFACRLDGAGRDVAAFNGAMAQLQRAFGELTALADQVAGGDLRAKARRAHPGDLGLLPGAMRAVCDGLSPMVATASQTARDVAGRSTALVGATGAIFDDIGSHKSQIAQVSEATASVQKSVLDITQQLGRSDAVAKSALETVIAGQSVGEQAEAALGLMKEDTDAINGTLHVIESIAAQTNLLAINASVEAARAGEMGRGFAVVSSEVKALATRSAECARDIRDIVERSQASVQSCADQVVSCSEHMEQVGRKVREISERGDDVLVCCDAEKEVLTKIRALLDQLASGAASTEGRMDASCKQAAGLGEVAHKLCDALDRFHLNDDLGAGAHPVQAAFATAGGRQVAQVRQLRTG